MNESKSDVEVLREGDDLEMMRRPHLWPNKGCLCLKNPHFGYKHRRDHHSHYAFAVLIKQGEEYFFTLREEKGWNQRGGDEMLVALVKEGWLVD